MPYFKDSAGACYFLSEEDIANGGLLLLPRDYIAITDEEAYVIQNPPPTPAQVLASQIQKLQESLGVAIAQKTALTNRISILQDAIDNIGVAGQEEFAATAAEQKEISLRNFELAKWKNYAIALGRLTNQSGWPDSVSWPDQPKGSEEL